jgi:hypothetical protein
VSLTSSEIKEVKQIWGKVDVPFFKLFKRVVGFNAQYCSDIFYTNYVVPALDPLEYYYTIGDKNFYDIYWNKLPQPKTIIKKIRGVFFDEKMNVLSNKEAATQCLAENILIYKKAKSSRGKDVEKIYLEPLSREDRFNKIADLFDAKKADFIIQKNIEQHPEMAKFNQSSVNCVRVTSLFLNGKISICSQMLRFGTNGSHIDNALGGGLFVGITNDGTLNKYAYDLSMNKYEAAGDILFADYKLPFYNKLEAFVLENHQRYLPQIGIVGWDLAIDKDGNVVMVEANIAGPGIFVVQISTGPIFGDRTLEVVDYVKKV